KKDGVASGQAAAEAEEDDRRGRLERHPERYERSGGAVVEQPHGGAAGKPGNAVNRVERPEGGAAPVHRNQARDGGTERGILHAESDGPAGDGRRGPGGSGEKAERDRGQGQQNAPAEDRGAVTIEQASGRERGEP